jgi:hypothetical protein
VPETPQQRFKRLLHEDYKLTPAQYSALLQAQGGLCAICAKGPKPGTRLCIDHCHATGVVRALLCTVCNLMVGVYERHHRAAAAYLSAYGAGNPLLKQTAP